MTTRLTNIFASARLLAAAMTSILLQGILAPTASSSTSDGFANFSDTPFVRPEPAITTFDAPGAGTGPGQGTLPFAINPAGTVLGYFIDAGDARHGFLRTPDGAITTFDAPGAGACSRTRRVKCGNGAVRCAQDTMTRIAGVNEVSQHRPCRVDGERQCALAGACPRARSIECGDGRLRANKGRVTEIQEAIARAAGGSGCEDTQ